MDNPDDEKTIVNIKSVFKRSWDRAKGAAERNDETLGTWVSRALDLLADRESGPREIVPSVNPPANPTPDPGLQQLFGMMRHLSDLAAATGQKPQKRTVSRLYSMVDAWSREQTGLGPKVINTSGLARGKAGLENGKALAFEAKFSEN
jgi:hypothetical protein